MTREISWKKCAECPGDGYVLNIFGDSKGEDIIYVPASVAGCYFPRSQLPLSNIIGPDEDLQLIIPKGIATHELHVAKKWKFVGLRRVDTTFSLFYASWDLEPRGGAYFYKGKFVRGIVPDNGLPKSVFDAEEYKHLLQKYFKLDSYELFERFFYVAGLPEAHRDAVAPLWKR